MAGLTIDWVVLIALVAPLYFWIATSGGPDPEGAAGLVVGNILLYVAPFLYWSLLPRTWGGRTIGRRVMGIRLLRAGDGRSVTYLRSLGRALLVVLLTIFLFIPLLIDLAFPLFGRHQSLSDRATDTVVTREPVRP